MLASGAIEEVVVFDSETGLSETAEKAIGVREIRSHLTGELNFEETVAAIQQATRRYAKRQGTWFRRESGFKSICLSPSDDASSIADKTLTIFPQIQR